jgi:hypothetical protein
VALFDFQPRTNQQQSVAQNPQPPSQTPNVDRLPAEVKAQAVEHGRSVHQLLESATKHRPEFQRSNSAPNAPGDGGKEALMHNQSDKSKTQESLSPTDSSKGNTQSQQRVQQRGRGMER